MNLNATLQTNVIHAPEYYSYKHNATNWQLLMHSRIASDSSGQREIADCFEAASCQRNMNVLSAGQIDWEHLL